MSKGRVHIRLSSGRDVLQLVQCLSSLEDSFTIENQSGAHRVNAKSILGVIYTALHFADGAMVAVVITELVPESQRSAHPAIMTLWTMLGFAVMMILDVALG